MNGWKNRITWGVTLVLNNDEAHYCRIHKYAHVGANNNVHRLADFIYEYVRDYISLADDTGMRSLLLQQILGDALAEVSWTEIASSFMEE